MNLVEYIAKYAPTLEKEREFAAEVGISHMYLQHMIKKRKERPGFEIAMGLIRASNGQIKLQTLRPDVFTDKESLKLLRKSAA